MTLLLLYFSFSQLGHPVYRVRAAAHRRCDCWLGAALAPADSPDPEVRRRVEAIRCRWRLPAWLAADADPARLLVWVQGCPDHRARLLAGWPLPPGMSDQHLHPPLVAADFAGLARHAAWHRPAVRSGLAAVGGGAVLPSR